MATSLRDIPGASKQPGRRRQRDPRDGIADAPKTGILVDPRQALGRPSSARRLLGPFQGGGRPSRLSQLSAFDLLLVLGALAVALFLARSLWTATRVDVSSTGLARTDALTLEEADDLSVRITVSPTGSLGSAHLTFDGKTVEEAERLDDGFLWTPKDPLGPGEHTLELTVPRPVLPESRFAWDFVVDPTPPALDTAEVEPHAIDEPVRITGRIDTDVALTADGVPVELDEEGRFALDYPRPPAGPVLLVGRDRAGYVVKREVFVPLIRPTVRGVHMTAISWRTDELREAVFDLIDQGKINTVELDLKDESGEVGYTSEVPLAARIGAGKGYYDLPKAVEELHARGVRVIGRVVAFRDPLLAKAAWSEGNRDWVVQTPDGQMHGSYGGFTNMASDEVVRYNLDIAAEGVRAGMDEILWDYIRRPEGSLAEMVFPGMPSSDRAVRDGVVDFLARGHELLRAEGVFQGASLFGIAAEDPQAVGQDVPQIARNVDYIAPMVYPSLWVPGQYKVANPSRMPGQIVSRSLEDFMQLTAGMGIDYTPWLQDFSLGSVTYGDAQVREQVIASQQVGIDGFLLWSPRVRYHAGQLKGSAG